MGPFGALPLQAGFGGEPALGFNSISSICLTLGQEPASATVGPHPAMVAMIRTRSDAVS